MSVCSEILLFKMLGLTPAETASNLIPLECHGVELLPQVANLLVLVPQMLLLNKKHTKRDEDRVNTKRMTVFVCVCVCGGYG